MPNTPAGQAAPPNDMLGGQLGAAIGNMIQQGLQPRNGRGRTLAPSPEAAPAGPAQSDPVAHGAQDMIPAPAQAPDSAPDAAQNSQPMNDVLKRLFNR
jgi:AsmA protein